MNKVLQQLKFQALFCCLFITSIIAQPTSWEQLNGPEGSVPQAILSHQGNLYMSCGLNSAISGVYRSSDEGLTWTDITNGLPVPGIKSFAALGNEIYAVSDTSIFTSNNNGNTWTLYTNGIPVASRPEKLLTHNNLMMALVSDNSGNQEMYSTTGAGAGWTFTGYTFFFPNYVLDLSASGDSIWAATNLSGVMISADNGISFSPASNNLPVNSTIFSIAADHNIAYCGTASGPYYTNDGGNFWIPADGGTVTTFADIRNIIIHNDTVYACVTNSNVMYAPSGSTNWNTLGSGLTPYPLFFDIQIINDKPVVGIFEGLYVFNELNNTWEIRNNGLLNAFTRVVYAEDSILLASVGGFTGLYRSGDYGQTWAPTNLTSTLENFRNAIRINNKIILAGQNSVHTSIDNGITWTAAPMGPRGQVLLYGSSLLACGYAEIHISNDEGQTWTPNGNGLPNTAITSIAVVGTDIFATAGGNGIYRLVNGSGTWTDYNQGISNPSFIEQIISHSGNLVALSYFNLFRRMPSDAAWTTGPVIADIPERLYSLGGYIWGNSSTGISFSDDLGTSFHPWNNGFNSTTGSITSLAYDNGMLYAGTQAASAWKRDAHPELTITSATIPLACPGDTIHVTASGTLNYDISNSFILQLSDSLGNFAEAINLDTMVQQTSPVQLTGIIPSSITSGSSFRYRVISSSPYSLSQDNGTSIAVNALPVIQLQPSNQSVCEGQAAAFYCYAVNTMNFQWQVDTGNGFFNLTDDAVYSGTDSMLLQINTADSMMSGYIFRCMVIGSCDSIFSQPVTLNVNTGSATVTQQPADATTCSGNTILFTITSPDAVSWQWETDYGTGNFSAIPSSPPYSGETSDTLTVIADELMDGYLFRCILNGCSVSDTAALTVLADPASIPPLNNAVYCPGDTAVISLNYSGSGLTFQWEADSGNGFFALTDTGMISGSSTGNLMIANPNTNMNTWIFRVIVNGTCFPSSIISTNASLIAQPLVPISLQPVDQNVCSGDTASFTADAGPVLYSWEMNDGNGWVPVPVNPPFYDINTATLKIYPVNALLDNVMFRSRIQNCTLSDSVELTVKELPILNVSTPPFICENYDPVPLNFIAPSGGTYFGTGIFNNELDPGISGSGLIAFSYVFTDTSGCSSTYSGNIQVDNCVGIEDLSSTGSLGVYPNPAFGLLNIILPVNQKGDLSIFDMQGKMVSGITDISSNYSLNLSDQGFNNGIYLLIFRTETGTWRETFIVQH